VLEQETRGVEERRVVIDDQAAHSGTSASFQIRTADQWSAFLLSATSPRKGAAASGKLLKKWTAEPLA
jgi:hypothetical protein